MPVNSEIIRKLAHGGLKSLHSLLDLLELFDMDSEGGLHDPETRKLFICSLQAVAQAIRDLRLIAICDDITAINYSINWKTLIEESLPRRFSKSVQFVAQEGNYEGRGHSEMLSAAAFNLAWFAHQFWKTPVKAQLKTHEKEGSSWIDFEWDFGNSVAVDPQFPSFPPYFPMFPKTSLTLDKSTGLALCAVKRILELHGGTLTAQMGPSLIIKWSCPKSSKPGSNIEKTT